MPIASLVIKYYFWIRTPAIKYLIEVTRQESDIIFWTSSKVK